MDIPLWLTERRLYFTPFLGILYPEIVNLLGMAVIDPAILKKEIDVSRKEST